MYGKDDTKVMKRKSWYITWENGQRKGSQNLKRKEIKKYIPKRRTLDSWLNYLGYAEDDFCISYSWFLFQTTHNRYFFSKIRLVLFPTLYKFIIWAGWAKAQSCLGFNPKLVLTIVTVCGESLIWSEGDFGLALEMEESGSHQLTIGPHQDNVNPH